MVGTYEQSLLVRLDEIAVLWAELMIDSWDVARARQIADICHALAGSAETFGHAHVSRVARLAESRLRAVLDAGTARPARLDAVREAIEVLLDAPARLTGRPAGVGAQAAAHATPARPTALDAPSAPRTDNAPIWIVEDDRDLADHMVQQLALHGHESRAFYSLAELDRALRAADVVPAAMVMDIVFPDQASGGIDIVKRFRRTHGLQVPVIFISGSDSFATRLDIIRVGGDAFFVKPLDVALLIERLDVLVGQVEPEALRVLVIDDDEAFGGFVRAALEDAGIDVRALTDPTEAIDVILDFRPDLVLLDVYMPHVNGMELAQVLRQHESCCDLPILFLSAEADPVRQAAALKVGVDGFLTKPVDHAYLVSAVANRAERARSLRRKVFRDSLTHLLVHEEIRTQLVNQLVTSRRHARPLAYAMIDIDRFKLINDSYGHASGDHVLKDMAGLLRRSFRRGDIVGRYGGEEFVVIMQDTPLEVAVRVVDRLREEFARMTHRSERDGERFVATFSAGISAYPDFDTAAQLQNQADHALYRAKDSGRNRVVVAQRSKPLGRA
ncbi:MAG TPA: diguanylate cyclase [Pseudomonadales bacterium]|nr:diguanylate cyclase [Pseudomonadales bacterium]